MTAYGNIDYGGGHDDLYGSDGTCDSSGYGFSNFDGVNAAVGNGGVSSYKLHGACNVSEKFTAHNFTGYASGLIWGQNQPWVGTTFNDNIHSMWILTG